MTYEDIINQCLAYARRYNLVHPATNQVDVGDVELALLRCVKRLADGWDLDAFTIVKDDSNPMFTTTTGNRRYALPDDFGRLIVPKEDRRTGIFLNDGSTKTPLDYRESDEFVRLSTTTSGIPSVFTIAGTDMLIDPPPRILLTDVPGLTPGKKVAVTAINTWGFESDPSNELTGNKPGNPTNARTEIQ